MAGKFAVVTGASTGIGLELAKIAAAEGYELLLVADTPFTEVPGGARTLEQDLSTFEGVDALLAGHADHGLRERAHQAYARKCKELGLSANAGEGGQA